MAVSRVTIHHEGDGSPTDSVDRFSEGGYSYGIGVTIWKRFRSVYVSWGTLHFNHVSCDICLSGNRMDYDVTDRDLALIAQVCADARSRGELVDHPDVVFHHDSPGSNTVCPGSHTYARQAAVVAACQKPTAVKPPVPTTKETDVFVAHCAGKQSLLVRDEKVHKLPTPQDELALVRGGVEQITLSSGFMDSLAAGAK